MLRLDAFHPSVEEQEVAGAVGVLRLSHVVADLTDGCGLLVPEDAG